MSAGASSNNDRPTTAVTADNTASGNALAATVDSKKPRMAAKKAALKLVLKSVHFAGPAAQHRRRNHHQQNLGQKDEPPAPVGVPTLDEPHQQDHGQGAKAELRGEGVEAVPVVCEEHELADGRRMRAGGVVHELLEAEKRRQLVEHHDESHGGYKSSQQRLGEHRVKEPQSEEPRP
ncbi:hypothetical protein TRICI_000654 [Trichomonascus ciferrii]|uniref:Uncharacterized protein n=1 Tax=Trichomonascus ciferrii TaxID=44093 RepID=A0A642VBJ6_9ASCO|nr:hypothetical protein TRICI_000654 [Trichomonascus ciferrii]